MPAIEFEGDWGGRWAYDPEDLLGEPGGFGAVYRGQDAEGAPVAVKVIPSVRVGGREFHPRLQKREVEVAERLRGEDVRNLIRIRDVGAVGNDVVIVMELASASLAELAGQPLHEDQVTAVLQETCSGLMELHQLGIIHRDLKPGNILQADGKWKVSDFGIAHDTDIGTQTYTFQGWGSFPYMAPELWQLRSPSVKTDLYALGCVAFELLTGTPPSSGPSLEDYRRQHLEEAPPNLDTENPALKDLTLRLLSKDASGRPQDARAVRERLERLAALLSSGQERLRQLAAEHATERSREDALRASSEAEAERMRELRTQARGDLTDLLREAVDLIGTALPEVNLRESGNEWIVMGPDGQLAVKLWMGEVALQDREDPIISVGEFVAANRRFPNATTIANCVCELEGGQLVWKVYRFRASAIVPSYELGPRDREHGFSESNFREERIYMLSPAMHIWTLSKVVLTADLVVDLYGEALDLS